MKVRIVNPALAGISVLWALVAAAQAPKTAITADSAKATYKELAPGASAAVVWGDMDKGPYAAFTKFTPGANHALHMHTSEMRIVVLKGAYIYKPEKGEEKRIGPGQFLYVPAGDRHVSGGDAKEGVLMYTESQGKFDLNFIK
jgi:mannose-6-phosphate isomerase-like protein (cupin superfamily)